MDWFHAEDYDLFTWVRLIVSLIGLVGVLILTVKGYRRLKQQETKVSKVISSLLLFVIDVIALQFLLSSLTDFFPEWFEDWAVVTSFSARLVLGIVVWVIVLNFAALEEEDDKEAREHDG
jgi:membrane protease YdiL (CAAX protease family)